MVRLFLVPVIVAAIGWMAAGPVPGLLAGILAAMLYPYWVVWRAERREAKADRLTANSAAMSLPDPYEQTEEPIDEFREAISDAHMTEADVLTVCAAYKDYRSFWYEHFSLDPSGSAHPLMRFPMWWRMVYEREASRMTDYAEFLNRRYEAECLGTATELHVLTYDQWRDDTAKRPYWRERLAYNPDAYPNRLPYRPDFYYRPDDFYAFTDEEAALRFPALATASAP